MEEIIFFRAGVRLSWPESFGNLVIPEAPKLTTVHPHFDFVNLIPNEEKISNQKLFPKISLNSVQRLDLRFWPTMTIDGADAKDLDDAISIARYENGDFLLAVHIADVAEYVEEGGDLDLEAYQR
jgi:ribonuclease R